MSLQARILICFTLVLLLHGCEHPPRPSQVSTEFNAQSGNNIADAPYLLPSCFDPSRPKNLKLVITAVGTDGAKSDACNIKSDENNTDFSLLWSKTNSNSSKMHNAIVTVRSEYLFSGKSEDRARLKRSFTAFQQSLLALEENEKSNCLNFGDAGIISNRVANALPLRLDEILAYNYGFDATDRVIDLQAGMRLRIEHGAYQFISPDGDVSEAYVGRGSSYLLITQRPNHTLAFEPFLGSLKAIEALASDPNKPPGRTRMISGAMDLAAKGVGRRYARIVYPPQYPTIKNTANGLSLQVGFLLANTAADLSEATRSYLKDGSCAADENNSVLCFYFSGRSFVVPEILVKIQGTEKYVPIGTTLRDVINSYTVTPIKQIGSITASGFPPAFKRWVQPALCKSNTVYKPINISFESHSPITGSNLSQWDMPLLKGDEFKW